MACVAGAPQVWGSGVRGRARGPVRCEAGRRWQRGGRAGRGVVCGASFEGREVSVELRMAGQECEAALEGCSVYLVGMMGTGTTTTASALASVLPGYSALDTDDLVLRATGQSPQEIIDAEGEPAFRKVEGAVLSQVAAFRNVVLATGGGVAATRENWMHLHNGVVVWLDVAAEEIAGRLAADPAREVASRPLLRTGAGADSGWGGGGGGDGGGGGAALVDTVARLLDERREAYAQADVRVDAGGGRSAEDVALAVLQEVTELVNSSQNKAYRRRLSNPQAFSMNAKEINTPIVPGPDDDIEA